MPAAWIAVDWGTSRLRLWAVAGDRTVIAQASSDKGMGGLAPDGFEMALLDLAAPYLDEDRAMPVLVCGMAGARQGWIEAPYATVPCSPFTGKPAKAPARDRRLDVRILPGLCQLEPPDVMRGEETQIAGFLAQEPGFAGMFCLPGTHTKWVRIADGRVTGFRTFMTGELFDLLLHQSILRHSIDQGWNDGAFRDAVRAAQTRPNVLPELFALRAQSLVPGAAPVVARARLSGLLIGSELAEMRPDRNENPIVLIGATTLSEHYRAAFETLGVVTRVTDGDSLTLAGLATAFARKETFA